MFFVPIKILTQAFCPQIPLRKGFDATDLVDHISHQFIVRAASVDGGIRIRNRGDMLSEKRLDFW